MDEATVQHVEDLMDAESVYSTDSEDCVMNDWQVDTGYRKWTYPVRHGRPLAEPPILEYDRFIEKKVPSDIRLRILFPDDIKKRTDYGDLVTEGALKLKHFSWTVDMRDAYEKESQESKFYDDLFWELCHDIDEMEKEPIVAMMKEAITPLMRWEWENIDQDGGTKKIEERLKTGDPWIFRTSDAVGTYVPEAREKYGHLASREHSREIAKRGYAIWKERNLGSDENTKNLEDSIRRGVDVRAGYGWEEIAEAKHGHLIPEGWRPRKRNEDGTWAPDELYPDSGGGKYYFKPPEPQATTPPATGNEETPPPPNASTHERAVSPNEPVAAADASASGFTDPPPPNIDTKEVHSQKQSSSCELSTMPISKPSKHSITLTPTITPFRLFLLLALVLEVWLFHHAWKEWISWLED